MCVLDLVCEYSDPFNRIDAGWPGIDPISCILSEGACFGLSWGAPWCFKKTRMYTADTIAVVACFHLVASRRTHLVLPPGV